MIGNIEKTQRALYSIFIAQTREAIGKIERTDHRVKKNGFISNQGILVWLLIDMNLDELKRAFAEAIAIYGGVPTLDRLAEIAICQHYNIAPDDENTHEWVRQTVSNLLLGSSNRALEKAIGKLKDWRANAILSHIAQNTIAMVDGELRLVVDPGIHSVTIDDDGGIVTNGGFNKSEDTSILPLFEIYGTNGLLDSALKGFHTFCENELLAAEIGKYDFILLWYLAFCRVLFDKAASKKALKAISSACKASARAENAIWYFYQKNRPLFKEAFEWHPDLAFEVDGRRKVYHVEIFYDAKSHFVVDASPENGDAKIIPAGHGDGSPRRKRSGNGNAYPKFDTVYYSEKFDEGFSRILTVIAEKAEEYYILGVKQDDNEKIVTLAGRYIVLAFRYRNLWWFLVESPYEMGQARICWGTQEDCLKTIALSPGEFRKAGNTVGCNHGLRRGEDHYDTIKRLMGKTICCDMFN